MTIAPSQRTDLRPPFDALGRQPSLLSINAYHYHRGGADNVYLAHAALFEQRGWRSSFQSMHHPSNLPSPDSPYFAEEINYAARGDIGRSLLGAQRIVYSREAQAKMAALLDSRPVDIAHVHSVYHHQSPSVLVELKRRGVPVVLTAHDLKLACPAYTMLNRTGICEQCRGGKVWNVAKNRCIKGSLVASTLIMVESAVHKALNLYDRNVDRIVTPSAFYRDKLIEWGWAPDKIVHIRNFADLPDAPPPFAPSDHLLYFGRLSPEKGLATVVRAAAATGIPVRLAGTGPQEAELRALVAELDAPVSFLGFLSGDALWAAVDGCRATILASEWYENGPMSAIEAFGRGKPLIGARIGGIPELIEDGVNGWRFASGDVDDLSRAMTAAMACSEGELRSMAEACHARAARDYAPDQYYAAMSDVYAALKR
ncbi:glycosyltransferase family 4 protein [Sphingomonas sp. VNH70]|uniref:glycosyltransferase family 4 protein n=1 Tax=Sphingomonas silueang TaxID=3156617 RepID=UPI0032B34890